jgi:hypothetical protein
MGAKTHRARAGGLVADHLRGGRGLRGGGKSNNDNGESENANDEFHIGNPFDFFGSMSRNLVQKNRILNF